MQRRPVQILMSSRDRAAVRERLAFVQAEEEKQRLADDQVEYRSYCKIIDDENRTSPPAVHIQKLDFDSWRAFAPQDQLDPTLRGQIATQSSLLKRTIESERNSVLNGRDPAIFIAPELAGVRMTEQEAIAFNKEQARNFAADNPDYYRCDENFRKLAEYMARNEVAIASEAMFKAAWERLRSFGAMLDKPEPEPEPEVVPEPAPIDDGSMVGIDPETGLPRRYTKREVSRMSSDQYREAFELSTQRRQAALQSLFSRR